MIKYILPFTFLIATFSSADTKIDLEGEQPNYELFEEIVYKYKEVLVKSINSNNKKDACIYNKMASSFFLNNIKYSEQFNKTHNTRYEDLLQLVQKNGYDSKEYCQQFFSK